MPKQNPSANNGGGAPVGRGSVRVIPSMGRLARAIKNTGEDARVGKMKEGIVAKAGAKEVAIKNEIAKDMGISTSKTIQINSSNYQPRIGGHAK